ncbi:MAG: flagellin [Vampirovibrionales bacterium]
MSLVINTNTSAINSQRNLGYNTTMLNRSIERLSSGYRINRAGDDAAGLQISENLRAQYRGAQKALDNVQDGMNVLNIADGGLQSITDNLQRMRELVVQAGNDTNGTSSRTAIKAEIDQLISEITRISDSTKFNGVGLLDGSTATINLQVGPNGTAANDVIAVAAFGDIDATALGTTTAAIVVTSNANALTSLGLIDTAIGTVNTRRSTIGSIYNRLEKTANSLSLSIENTQAAESRIRNVDVAKESAELTRFQILQQSAAAMLAQANQTPSIALKLLGN